MEVFAREPCRRRCANETRSNVRTSMFQGFGSPSALQVNALWLRVLSGGQCVLRHLEWWLNHLPWSSDAGLVGHDTEAVHQWSLNCINTKSSLTTIISFCRSFSCHVRDPWRGYYYYAQQYNRCSIDRKYSCSNVRVFNLSSGNIKSYPPSLSLFGVTCVQTYIYYNKNRNDGKLFMSLVWSDRNLRRWMLTMTIRYIFCGMSIMLFIAAWTWSVPYRFLDIFQLVFVTHASYYLMVTNFGGNLSALFIPPIW